MSQSTKTVIFDLDGTIYQNTTFHRDYIHAMVADTPYTHWEQELIALADDIFAGKKLRMNHFYKLNTLDVNTPAELAERLEQQLCPALSYQQALTDNGVIYLGDAWAVLSLLGHAMGCLDEDRSNAIYRQTRQCMERAGMHGNPALRKAIIALHRRCRVILISNSYEQTVQEFLRQLDYSDVFSTICYSAHKPYGMIENLQHVDPLLLQHPQDLISIGDHAFNDLMPIASIGGKTVWMNPYPDIAAPACDLTLSTLDELALYLDTL